MPIEIEAYEAEDFATAIPGLDVEYVRTDGGNTPCRMTVAESDHAALSIGSMGFSATSRSEIPSNVGVFALITSAPSGGRYCGVDLDDLPPVPWAPGMKAGVVATGKITTTQPMTTFPTEVDRYSNRLLPWEH